MCFDCMYSPFTEISVLWPSHYLFGTLSQNCLKCYLLGYSPNFAPCKTWLTTLTLYFFFKLTGALCLMACYFLWVRSLSRLGARDKDNGPPLSEQHPCLRVPGWGHCCWASLLCLPGWNLCPTREKKWRTGPWCYLLPSLGCFPPCE